MADKGKMYSLRKPKIAPPKRAVDLGKEDARFIPKAGEAEPPLRRPPLRAGSLMMSDREIKDIGDLGYARGDAIPPETAQKISEIRRAHAAEYTDAVEELAASGKAMKMPSVTDISKLPPEKQKKLMQAMAEAQQQLREISAAQARAAEVAELPPGLQEAARASMGRPGPVEVFDGAAAEEPAPAATQEPAGGPEVATAEEQPLATGATDERCAHCNWPRGKPDLTEPDKADIFNYKTAMVGGPTFLKEFSMLDGALRVSFRIISADVHELIMTQVQQDLLKNAMLTAERSWQLLWDYRLVAGLHKVVLNGLVCDVAAEVDAWLAEWRSETKADDVFATTPLPKLLMAVRESEAVPNESSWRVMGQLAKRFNDIVEKLEAMLHDPSFYRATGI